MSDDRSALLRASTPPSKELFSTLITANHILHYHNVVDAFGHISVRNPQNPATFFISKSLAPALISRREDLEEYHVNDASPVNKDAPKGYAERFIHSEVYKRYEGVRSVVHSHSEAVLPYSIAGTPLRPVFHMGGVMGAQVPVYDIALHYKGSDDLHSMLVVNEHLGQGLALGLHPQTMVSKTTSFVKNFVTSTVPAPPSFPSNPTILMRGHGFTCCGDSIEQAVYRAIFTCTNARVQTTALLMQGNFNMGRTMNNTDPKSEVRYEDIKYLSDRECRDAWTANQGHAERPWKLWCAEVASSSLYENELGAPPGA